MMARQHVTFGVAVTGSALATTSYFVPAVESWVHDHPLTVAAFMLLIAGGCIIPDADHHNSTIVKKAGVLGWAANMFLRLMGIKHRGFMHTFLFAAISGVFFLAVEYVFYLTQWAMIAVVVLLSFYASVTLGFVFGRIGNKPAVPFVVALLLVLGFSSGYINLDGHWLAIGAFLGPVLHDVGDMMTHGKLPFWAPFSKKRYGSPVTFRTNSWYETVVLRYFFFAWSLVVLMWVPMLATGFVEKTDFSQKDWTWFVHSLPYVLWTPVS